LKSTLYNFRYEGKITQIRIINGNIITYDIYGIFFVVLIID